MVLVKIEHFQFQINYKSRMASNFTPSVLNIRQRVVKISFLLGPYMGPWDRGWDRGFKRVSSAGTVGPWF